MVYHCAIFFSVLYAFTKNEGEDGDIGMSCAGSKASWLALARNTALTSGIGYEICRLLIFLLCRLAVSLLTWKNTSLVYGGNTTQGSLCHFFLYLHFGGWDGMGWNGMEIKKTEGQTAKKGKTGGIFCSKGY